MYKGKQSPRPNKGNLGHWEKKEEITETQVQICMSSLIMGELLEDWKVDSCAIV